MKATVSALRSQFILLVFLVSLVWTNIGYAQQPSPTASPSSAPSASPSASSGAQPAVSSSPAPSAQASIPSKGTVEYQAYPLDKPLPSAAPVDETPADQKKNSAAPSPSAAASPSPAASPSAAPIAPASPAGAAPNAVAQPNVQGVVTVDVSAPDTIRAGEEIKYTYTYVNLTSATVTDIEIQALWTNFTSYPDGGAWQWCEPGIANCGLVVDSVEGPTVTPIGSPHAIDGMRFKIGALAPGKQGQFTLQLRSNSTIFPRTNEQIRRPAGSAKLFTSVAGGKGTNEPTSDDTANTMIVGPVFNLSKTPLNTQPVYPGEIAEFVIRVGNATGMGDKTSNQVRADATDATKVVLTDMVPWGSEFVSADMQPVKVDGRTITWNIASLPVGQTQQVTVKFRKLDQEPCGVVDNNQYFATSDEMPSNGDGRFVVFGPGAAVGVTTPMRIKYVAAMPGAVVYGKEAEIEIVVQNFLNQPVNGAQLHYDIQTNVFYVPNTASPTASASPDSTQRGGRLTWTFDMPAGSKTVPAEKTFKLRVRGDYTNVAEKGVAILNPPSGVPSACSFAVGGRVGLLPRLIVTKRAELTTTDGQYRVRRGDTVVYTVEVSNVGVANATGVTVKDFLPREPDANFSYVPGSATTGSGTKREPDVITNGYNGTLAWNNVTVPVNGKVVFRYEMIVDGRDYGDYCNVAEVASGKEDFERRNNVVCIRINPNIEITKTTTQQGPVRPGTLVEFTLTLTNYESVPYTLGLYDAMGPFTFVEQKQGYAQPERMPNNNDLRWPQVSVPGRGGQISATIVARVPDRCINDRYWNEALFYNPTSYVRRVPPMSVPIDVVCNLLEYELFVDRPSASLQDRVLYTVDLRNRNPATDINNVAVETLLPEGFSWVGYEGSSNVTDGHKFSTRNGRPVISWNIPTVDKGSVKRIRFFAKTGNTVGWQEARMIAATPNAVLQCTGECKNYADNGTDRPFATKSVQVDTLITIVPEIAPSGCVSPGAKLTYRLQLVNTNNHPYTSTTVRATLPLGLTYLQPRPNTPAPLVSTNADGVTQVVWLNMTVPSKPDNAVAAQVTLEIEVQVGQVWGELVTVEQATSADGAIPRQDDVQNASVLVCPTMPAVAKAASQPHVKPGNTVVYQISLANPTDSEIQATVEDTLPEGLEYVGMVSGPAPTTVTGNTLRWQVTLPAAKDGKPGTPPNPLQVRVRVLPSAPQGVLRNVAKVTAPTTTEFDTRFNTAKISVFGSVYIPMARR